MDLKKLSEFDVNELAESFQNLDPENVGSWPAPVKVIIFIAVFVGVIFLGNYLFINQLKDDYQRQQTEQTTLLQQFEEKHHKAKNLDQYKGQLVEMENSFGALVRQLPSDTEVPGLLEDISHTGLGAGLDFEEITLRPEVPYDFYVELPITIKVRGDYHSFGAFVSGVAALPRIVTLHDFKITRLTRAELLKEERNKNKSEDEVDVTGSRVLRMEITAKTYRYNSKEG